MRSSYAKLLNTANQYVAVSACKPGVVFTKAKGSKIWLNGKPCLDFACGPGVANVGWNHPEVAETVYRVLRNNEAGWGGNMILNRYQIELAERLCAITPGTFPKKVFFSNSGGEAVEAATIACMKRRPERPGTLSFLGDFHGRLGFGRTATTSKPLHVERMPWGVPKAFYLGFPSEGFSDGPSYSDDTNPDEYMYYVESTIGSFLKEINFALFELVQGEGGINVARRETIQKLFDYLRKNDIWIIVDEVQTGLGRTGKMWASELYGVEPDIITVAKALGGGVMPIGATIMRDDLAYQKHGEHCNTFGAAPLACAVGLKVLDIIEKDKLVEKSEASGNFLRDYWLEYLNSLSSHTHAVAGMDCTGGVGMMNRITFDNQNFRNNVENAALGMGLFLTGAGQRSLRLMPPLTISKNEIKKALKILAEAISQIAEGY